MSSKAASALARLIGSEVIVAGAFPVISRMGFPAMLAGPRCRSQSQWGGIGLQMKQIELTERLGRWPAGRGPLPVLLAARLRRLIDEGELPPGEPLPADRALAAALAVGGRPGGAAHGPP